MKEVSLFSNSNMHRHIDACITSVFDYQTTLFHIILIMNFLLMFPLFGLKMGT